MNYGAIDPAVLWQAAAADRDAFQMLAATFLETAPPLMERLRTGLERRRLMDVAAASHSLKGMTVLVGAASLSALLQQIERAARTGQPPPPAPVLQPLFTQVMQEVARSRLDYQGEPA